MSTRIKGEASNADRKQLALSQAIARDFVFVRTREVSINIRKIVQ